MNVVFASAASIWEIAIRRSVGKLKIPGDYPEELPTTDAEIRRYDVPLAAI